MIETNYKCQHCSKRFVHEERFIKHECKEMKREKEFREPHGQMAWIFYQKWLRSYNKVANNAAAFINSRYFNSFMKFAQFAKRVKLPDTDAFVAVMRDHDISPTIWTMEEVYNIYLEHLDKKLSPQKHAQITINTLFNHAEDHETDVATVFDTLTPNDVIKLVRERRLSPWILLNSVKFGDFFVNQTNSEQRIILETMIRPAFWQKKFKEDPDSVEQMKRYVEELKL